MSNQNGLWTMEFGQVAATLKALQDAGMTLQSGKIIRSNPDAAAAMVAALKPFLRPVNPHPERHYDLSAVLGITEPLQNIVWPQVELAENQFLVAYRGEAPSQVLPNVTTKEVYIWDKLPTFPWWTEGVKPGIYLVTLPLPNSGGMQKSEKAVLCKAQGGVMTPFILNAMLRLAHKALTGELVGGWTICPELAYPGCSAYLCWFGAQLCCNGHWSVNACPDLFASSSVWLSSLEF